MYTWCVCVCVGMCITLLVCSQLQYASTTLHCICSRSAFVICQALPAPLLRQHRLFASSSKSTRACNLSTCPASSKFSWAGWDTDNSKQALCIGYYVALPRRSRYALHPVLSVRLSVRPSICPLLIANSKTVHRTTFTLWWEAMIGNLSSKCERCTMYCFMWGGQKVKGQGHWDRNVKIVVGAYLREKCINSREYKTVMTPTLCCTFCRIQCSSEMQDAYFAI